MILTSPSHRPASFESSHYRLRYTMSLALLCRPANAPASERSRLVKCASHPFHILPSTLPSPAPELPILTYNERQPSSSHSGLIAGLCRSLSLPGSTSATSLDQVAMTPSCHVVTPSLPTSHFSPGSLIPLTLRILSTPLSRNSDLYVRLALIRKVYVRDAQHAPEADNEWGLPDEMVWEQWRVSEDTLCSRWGYVPCEARIRSEEEYENAEVIMSDISLPVGGGSDGWQHGYSTAIDLPPSSRPSASSSTGSWFSPALQSVIAGNAKDADRHLHVSTRFYLSVEIGFHSSPTRLGDLLAAREAELGGNVPRPSTFTKPAAPGINPFPGDCSGSATPSPFLGTRQGGASTSQWEKGAASSGASFFGRSSSASGVFPGTVRELLIVRVAQPLVPSGRAEMLSAAYHDWIGC